MTAKTSRFLAWAGLFAILIMTLCPLEYRPRDVLPVDVDRALAFAVATMLFILAYPRYRLLIFVAMLAGAGGIEALQLLAPSRHPEIHDAFVKAGGVSFGAAAGLLLNALIARFFPTDRRRALP